MTPSFAVKTVRAVRRKRFALQALNRVNYGHGFVVGPRARVSRSGSVKVGDRVSIGADFTCHVNFRAGDNIMISSNVALIGDDHPFDESDRTIQDYPPYGSSSVTLEGDNLVGFGSIIIGPVVVGYGAIIGAGSVVTSNVPPNTVWAGVPARQLRRRRESAADG